MTGLRAEIEHRIREPLTFRAEAGILPHGGLPHSGQKTTLIEVLGKTGST